MSDRDDPHLKIITIFKKFVKFPFSNNFETKRRYLLQESKQQICLLIDSTTPEAALRCLSGMKILHAQLNCHLIKFASEMYLMSPIDVIQSKSLETYVSLSDMTIACKFIAEILEWMSCYFHEKFPLFKKMSGGQTDSFDERGYQWGGAQQPKTINFMPHPYEVAVINKVINPDVRNVAVLLTRSTCPPCINFEPKWQHVKQSYRSNHNVKFLEINFNERDAQQLSWIAKSGIDATPKIIVYDISNGQITNMRHFAPPKADKDQDDLSKVKSELARYFENNMTI